MPENHLWDVYYHHISKHGVGWGGGVPYLYYEKNKYASGRIKLVSNTKTRKKSVGLKIILAEEKAIRDAKKSVPDIGVRQVNVSIWKLILVLISIVL